MFSQDRKTHRQAFVDAWAKSRTGQPLTPLESQIVQVLATHPEYADTLEDPDAILDRDYALEPGEHNPFLHLGLHIAVIEQLSIDRPAGIRKLHRGLATATGDLHEAEHRIMQCLVEALWRVQHDGKPFNEKAYLKCIRRAGGGARPRER
jgi:hypothetical protein